jgi:hypothetical protein
MMRRLTLSTYDRSVYGWLRRHPPPLPQVPSATDLETLQVQMHQHRLSDQAAEVTARVEGLPSTSNGRLLELRQHWEDREGTWFFIPSAR